MADSINYSKIRSSSDSSITPAGTILPWSKAIAPTGFLKCDGSAVSRTTYSDLFAVIGTTYGSGDGSTTFNLPDLASRNLIGSNTATSVGQTGGAADTTGAGFTLQNNLSAQNTQNLAVQVSQNLSTSDAQNLGIQNAQNLAGSSVSNKSISGSQNLGLSVQNNLSGAISGNVSNHTLTLGQIPSHNHPGVGSPGNTSSLKSDLPTSASRPSTPSAGSSQAHNHGHNLTGSLNGSVTGNITGNVVANITGGVTTNITGNANANLSGNVGTNVSGNHVPSLTGNAGINLSGDVTAQNASIYQKHLVVIYIIKH